MGVARAVLWAGAAGLAGLLLWAVPHWRGPALTEAAPRDRPPALQAAAMGGDGPITIVALGTSLSARGPWPDDLAARLTACLEREVRITRVAEPGVTVAWGQAPARISAVAAAAPDVILMEFAINDADLRDGLPRAEADARSRALLAELTEAAPGAVIVEMTMSPAHGLRGVLRPGLAARYDDVVARAEDRGGAVADLHGHWLNLPRAARRFDDGLHPDPDLAAEVIVAPLAALLAPAFGASCSPADG
jgi:acyl-CoA thioesterase-1